MQNIMIFMFCPQFLQNLFLSCWPLFPTALFSHLFMNDILIEKNKMVLEF